MGSVEIHCFHWLSERTQGTEPSQGTLQRHRALFYLSLLVWSSPSQVGFQEHLLVYCPRLSLPSVKEDHGQSNSLGIRMSQLPCCQVPPMTDKTRILIGQNSLLKSLGPSGMLFPALPPLPRAPECCGQLRLCVWDTGQADEWTILGYKLINIRAWD